MDIKFYEPDSFRTQHKSNRQASNSEELIDPVLYPDLRDTTFGLTASCSVKMMNKLSLKQYNQLISAGVCREQARGVLTQNLYTEYYGTSNLSNLLKFIDLRTHVGAQWEIQKVAEACLEIATDLFLETVGAYRRIRNEE